MINLSNAYETPDADLFAEFADDTEEGGSLPHAQIVNPVNLTEAEIKKHKIDVKFGLFIAQEQADAVNFKPDKRWEEYTAEFGTEETVEVPGYISTTVDCVILHRSGIEVQEKQYKDGAANGWRFAGLAYDRGQITEHGQRAKDSADYRLVNRLLIFLLGEDGKPLHETPLQLMARGGFGGAFGTALRDFHKEADQSYAKAARSAGNKIKGGRLNDFAKAHLRFVCELNRVPKSGDSSPYVCVKSRIAVNGVAGNTKVVKQGDREITLTTCTIVQVMVPKTSGFGQQIAAAYYENEQFGEPNRGNTQAQADGAATGGNAGGAVDAHGFFNWSAANYTADGAKVPFTSDSGDQYLAVVGEGFDDIFDAVGTVHITGTDDGAKLIIESAQLLDNASDGTAPVPTFAA